MNFSSLSIKNPIPAIMLFALLTLAGLLAFKANRGAGLPGHRTAYRHHHRHAGRQPRRPSWKPKWRARSRTRSPRLQGVKNIYDYGVGRRVHHVTVEFILEKQISDAVNEVRDAVARVKADMPAELRDPTVTKAATAGRVIMTFTAAAAPKQGRREDGRPRN